MIFVNFKTYPQGTGERALELAKICEEVSKSSGVTIIPVIQAVDLTLIKKAVSIPVWVQHLDQFPQGKFTGWINLEAVIEAGAEGTLLNHSEHQLPPGMVKQVISRAKGEVKSGKKENFEVMVCAKTFGQAKRLAKLKPDFLAYEPVELIGNRGKSVASERPKTIKKIAEAISVPLIVGAGIHSQEDVKISLKMGAKGILVATDVVLSRDPRKALVELIDGFKGDK